MNKSLLHNIRITFPCTADDLLVHVGKLIAQEPKRYDQGATIEMFDDMFADDQMPLPECGTICCIGGWAFLALGPSTLDMPRVDAFNTTTRIPLHIERFGLVQALLGLDIYEADDLFSGNAVEGEPGTPEYVEAGLAHLNQFRLDHPQLKDRIIQSREVIPRWSTNGSKRIARGNIMSNRADESMKSRALLNAFHALWGTSKDKAYDKPRWIEFQRMLEDLVDDRSVMINAANQFARGEISCGKLAELLHCDDKHGFKLY